MSTDICIYKCSLCMVNIFQNISDVIIRTVNAAVLCNQAVFHRGGEVFVLCGMYLKWLLFCFSPLSVIVCLNRIWHFSPASLCILCFCSLVADLISPSVMQAKDLVFLVADPKSVNCDYKNTVFMLF